MAGFSAVDIFGRRGLLLDLIRCYSGFCSKFTTKDRVFAMTHIDRLTAPIGTRGYLAPSSAYDFEGDDDWEFMREPYAVLNEQRQWVGIEAPYSQGVVAWSSDELLLFGSSDEAIRYAMLSQIKDAMNQISEAKNDIDSALKILERLDSEGA